MGYLPIEMWEYVVKKINVPSSCSTSPFPVSPKFERNVPLGECKMLAPCRGDFGVLEVMVSSTKLREVLIDRMRSRSCSRVWIMMRWRLASSR